MASTIDYSLLTKYTDQLAGDLLREAVLGGKTLNSGISKRTGIKYAEAINIMNSTLVPKAASCGAYSATGSVTLKQVNIQVCPLMVEETICLDDQEQYYLGKYMPAGSYGENPAQIFAEGYAADKVSKIQRSISDYAWKGSTTATFSSTHTLCNGWLYDILVTNSGSFISATATTGALTSANAIAVVDSMVDAMNANAVDISESEDLTLYMSIPNFMTYARAWRDRASGAGAYHIPVDGKVGSKHEFIIPGTTIKVIGEVGLNNLNKMVLTPAENLYFGTDLENDATNFRMEYIFRDNQILFRAKYKIGFKVAFPQYCIVYNG